MLSGSFMMIGRRLQSDPDVRATMEQRRHLGRKLTPTPMSRRIANVDDLAIGSKYRLLHWLQLGRSDDHPGLSELDL